MVKDEGRQSPETLLEYGPLEGVAGALRSHSRGSQRVLEVHSLLALNLVRSRAGRAMVLARVIQFLVNDLPRTLIPRTPVNKDKRGPRLL
jgi:hypothetical protein